MRKDDDLPKLPEKEATVLAVLLTRPSREMFGLEIVEGSDGLLKRGTVYVTLQRMEEKGLIESRREPRPAPEVGIARRMYRATGLGQRALKAYSITHKRVSNLLSPA